MCQNILLGELELIAYKTVCKSPKKALDSEITSHTICPSQAGKSMGQTGDAKWLRYREMQ